MDPLQVKLHPEGMKLDRVRIKLTRVWIKLHAVRIKLHPQPIRLPFQQMQLPFRQMQLPCVAEKVAFEAVHVPCRALEPKSTRPQMVARRAQLDQSNLPDEFIEDE